LCLSIYTCHERSFCDPGTGQCIHEDKQDGEPCNDGDGCTTGEFCTGGVCGGGTPVVCEGDGNPCLTPPTCISFGDGFGGCTDLFREPVPSGINGISCGDNGEFCCHGNCCNGGEVCSLGLVCAACKDILDTCATDDQCCSGICDPNLKLCVCQIAGLNCSQDRNCCGVTNPGCCNATCVDLNIDLVHCGSCNNPAPVGAICIGGSPSCQGDPNLIVCNNTCVDTNVDLHHCGRCNHACNIGSEVCSVGHCCPVGFEWTGTRCCPIGFHEDGGICCSAGFHASNGLCCAVGMTNCGGTCVNTSVDLNHCGQCFRPAPAGGVCLGGVPQCTLGFHNDNGRCCAAGSHNEGPFCCVDGFRNCGGICVSTGTDPLNCGSCGRHCSDFFHPACFSGRCCTIIGTECS
jgi:hypothetical protein